MNMHRQNAQLLDLFKRDGTVTRLTAMHYGIANVTARIADLRLRHGINVVCEKRTDAKGKTYGAWSIKKTAQDAKVGDRIRVNCTPKHDAAFFSQGAEGVVRKVYGSTLYVAFDKGTFRKDYNDPTWYVLRDECEVV
jgi:hypothetical protein